MRLLLDTHTFLWFIADHPSLSQRAKDLIEDGANDVYLSIASVWEMAIKVSLGKLTLGGSFGSYIPEQLHLNSIDTLSITIAHAAAVATLPLNHRDPFDRLLIAQAHIEGTPIVSADTAFDAYSIVRLW